MTESSDGTLVGRRVVVGVSGSIAAYKAAVLVRQLAAAGAIAPVGLGERTPEDRPERLPLSCDPGADEQLQAPIPPQDVIVHVDHEQRVRQRLDDAVVELVQPLDLGGLAAELAVQPRVLDRGGRLRGDGAEQRHVLAAEDRGLVQPAPQLVGPEGRLAPEKVAEILRRIQIGHVRPASGPVRSRSGLLRR